MYFFLFLERAYQSMAVPDEADSVIDGCKKDQYQIVNPGLLEYQLITVPANGYVCLAIDTVFIVGEKLKITVSQHNTTYKKPKSSKYFIGVSTYCREGAHSCKIVHPTLLKIESSLSSEQQVYIIGAERSIKTRDYVERQYRHNQYYFSSYKSTSLLTEYTVSKVNRTEGTYQDIWDEQYHLYSCPVTIDNDVTVSYRKNHNIIRVLSNMNANVTLQNLTDEKGTVNTKGATIVGLDPKELPAEKIYEIESRAYVKWKLNGQNKNMRKFIGRIKNDNKILNFGNLVGIYELPIWAHILIIVIICLLVIAIIIALIICCWRFATVEDTTETAAEEKNLNESSDDVMLSE